MFVAVNFKSKHIIILYYYVYVQLPEEWAQLYLSRSY